MVKRQSPCRMTPWANGPLELAIVIDIRHQKVDGLLDTSRTDVFITDCEKQPFEHMTRGLNLALDVRLIASALKPVGAKAAVWVL